MVRCASGSGAPDPPRQASPAGRSPQSTPNAGARPAPGAGMHAAPHPLSKGKPRRGAVLPCQPSQAGLVMPKAQVPHRQNGWRSSMPVHAIQ
eukprot:scaffold13576_cov125-Isochrysis_galbana.AAC.4